MRAHDPGPVGLVQMDRHGEGLGPVLHRGVVVRVRERDGAQAAEPADEGFRGRVEQRDAVPEDVAARGLHDEGALVDGEGGEALQAEQARLMRLPGIAVTVGQRRAGRP